ncbi:MAG: VOC family protein [Actinomyces sp.]|uniref:VOC family protein n=1 Tax=Actinomyces sp. TaxID=29317 RepID=UPI0026DB161D|nr:VOC family protein [Actinomyces sp.]MDO4243267.1 VOC family protein [Actinomyces sp.]
MWVRHAESFEGPGDHLVSQAFYFHDPEGNGVELYWDRPRETWQWVDGRVRMETLPIDPNEFLARHLGASATRRAIAEAKEGQSVGPAQEVAADDGLGVAGGVGHVHLRVGDIDTARAFYVDALGFEVTSEMPSSALFVSAGGYHHHMAMNVWGSRGAGLRAPALGLGTAEILVPDPTELAAVRERLGARGVEVLDDDAADRLLVADPWGNELRLAVG